MGLCWRAGHRTISTPCSAGLRSSAQMISYELSLGLMFVTAIILANSMSLHGYCGRTTEHVVRVHPACGRVIFLIVDAGRGEPRALRYARSRAGIDRWLSQRVFRHEVRLVLHGRISEDDRDLALIAATLFFGGYREFWFLRDTISVWIRFWWLGPIVFVHQSCGFIVLA